MVSPAGPPKALFSKQVRIMYTEEPSDLTAGKRIDAERRCPTRALNEPYVEKEA
jgi:hypothetical protein